MSLDHAAWVAPDVVVLGLDIGGTKLAAGLVTGDGQVLARSVIPSRTGDGPTAMLERQVDLGRQIVSESGIPWASIRAVGVACGGPLDPWSGTILSPPNLPGWDDIPVAAIVEEALDTPTHVDNDANGGALAEWRFGAGHDRRVDDLIYLTISTGIGGGIILDGRLYHGATGNAGELGHLSVVYDGRPCRCGRRGCLEAYASGTSIAQRATEALARDEPSALRDLDVVTAADVTDAAVLGDPLASRIWAETIDILGSAIANIIDIFDPALVILGGGVMRAKAPLLEPVRALGKELAYGPAAASADIVAAGLGERHDVVSAAVIALDRLAKSS
jgi:glucokinase